ncbi:alpha-1,2 glucosyltransferas-like protein alg10 [Lindgomyces ingoldianus]|uniref:Alpha-1,2 glucosyltransferas-like protein alg10 n=1 Tax=Lindgomyces ingoldianus TaxID=673940 RepID=A0ACB6QYB9_9PLEO|nr:alpha-1,2 glucosyltransferas-like protein alg10 [Lindgomyces ingoldianus]KAF2471520.1 alpha-1,2 glucosyltransferas-like protein alg10 [Lindgomyces ingoldianus]
MLPLMQTWALSIAVIVIASATRIWYKLVSRHVPNPYLDEVFHVPQAQRYCKGDYSWDPKITTPPGLQKGQGSQDETQTQKAESKQTALVDAHTALNIALFPPLFFFSGLYYTDVISTLLVLLSYNMFLKRGRGRWRFWENFTYIQVGIVALSFRQTNVFWVAVFPAGLAVIDTLKKNGAASAFSKTTCFREALKESWVRGRIHDCPVQEAGLQDVVLFSISTPIAVLGRLFTVLRELLPYLVLLGLFAGFVAWNGGVVLGDKSNHIATIHLPQMLYIWPYIVFFSLPLAAVPFLSPLVRGFLTSQVQTFYEKNLVGRASISAPGFVSAILFLVFGLGAVHFNTIVHPFTLADNRHYVFYVFRILRRHPVIKYLAVPIYYLCYWMTIQALGSRCVESISSNKPRLDKVKPISDKADFQPCQISFFAVWLATTALSVITAPLIEPRYFIIPWIIWRLHISSLAASPSTKRLSGNVSYNMRLALETVWLLAINAIVGYNFLYRGFSWTSEPGRVQRFLW